MGHLTCISIKSNTNMLIVAVVLLVTVKAEAVLNPFGNSETATEKDNVQSIDSIDYNVELYRKEESRAATVHKRSSYQAYNWTCPIDKLGDHPSPWYRYLNSLYCQFSKYEIQVAKKSFNVANIEDWGRIHVTNLEKRPTYDIGAWKNNTGQGLKIDGINFKKFLSKTEIYNIAEQNSIRNMKIRREQLNELNHVLDITIKDQMHISCIEPYMFIRGNYIIFSHINLSIAALPHDDSCRNLTKTGGITYMNIFALNTIFIDDDIRKRTNLTLIAPKFEIIGRRKIDLNGEDGKEQNTTAVSNESSLPGKSGEPGKPGEPGGPGGNFFGIGEEFVHGENLTISVNGGHGSAGQDGGNGTNGKDGLSPTKPSSVKCRKGLCESGELLFECEQKECRSHWTPAMMSVPSVLKFDGCTYRLYGGQGSPGGNGGDGGKGGEGGYPGEIVFLELNGRSGITQIENSGSNGRDGKGGVGGVGGRKGNQTNLDCDPDSWNYAWSMTTSFSDERAQRGKDGKGGKNTRDMPERRGATYISKVEKAKIINQYKSFLRVNMSDSFRHSLLVNFLNRMENNENVTSIYDFFGFVDELESLEEQFLNLNKDVNFLPFYGSLLDRISEYAQKVNTSNDKKVLAAVYTATLGRKHNIEDDLESNLVTDIASYLESVKDDIETIKDLQNGKAKEVIINKYKKDYKSEIDKKINDANDLISKEIIPQIHIIEKDIDGQIEKWVNETEQLLNNSLKDSAKLSESRAKLQNALALQKLFGVLKIVGTVVSFMGPVGAIAGSAIGITSSLAETYMIDVPSDSGNAVKNFEQSVKDIGSLKDKISSFNDEKTGGLNKALKTISSEIKDNTDEFGDLNIKVRAISSRLREIDRNKITVQEIAGLEIELKTTLKAEKEKKITEANNNPDKKEKKTKAVAVLDHLQKVVELSSVVVDAFDKIEKSQKKLDEIDKAIKKNKEKFDKLREYEASIYSTMVPMIEHIESDLDDVISKSRTNAKVVLDVNKWKVQSKLKDLMLKMHQVTQNFTEQENLVRYIEKLQEAMETILNVQGYIQDYQEDQTLANFIADINSVTVNGFDNSHFGKEYRDALRDLDIIITSSIVIQRYKVAMDAFKQFVFPFAEMYFGGSLLPSHLELENKNNPSFHIRQMNKYLKQYKKNVKNCDQCIATGAFYGKSHKPFFVWRSKNNKNMISKLLSGEEVIVKANITSSPKSADAIKCNFIKFYFKPIKNSSFNQSVINKAFKNFWMNATHLGDSYYRFNNKTYLMKTADVNFRYSFKNQGNETHETVSFQKVKNGDFILSPYTSWKIKLFVDKDKEDKVSFNNLQIYKQEVNLVLGGMGRYVLSDCYCSDLMVDKYYKAYEVGNKKELYADNSLPLLEDEIPSRDRHEINQESVTVNEERWITQHNHAR